MAALSTFLCLTLFFLHSLAAPILPPQGQRHDGLNLRILHRERSMQPVLPIDFPDPSLVQDHDGAWYAFATNSGGVSIQVAKAEGGDPFGRWGKLDVDALPQKTWTSGRNTWAPDVKALDDGSYIMYFSGEVPDSHQHCVGVARSRSITGPYTPDPEPWVCPREAGGAIDASGFVDEATGRRYVVYKVDGNSQGDFSKCGTGVNDPKLRTPLMLQQVDAFDGSTKIGQPIELMNRIPEQDGALIEAPELVRRADGKYVLFFSSHCFNDPKYDIKYAWSDSPEGPFQRADSALLSTPEFDLNGPGGVTTGKLGDGGDFMAFHGYCQDNGRCLYVARYGDE